MWAPAYDTDGTGGGIRDGAWVAELTGLLDLTGWPTGMRVIARKERPHPGAQLRIADVDGHRVTAFAPTPPLVVGTASWVTSSCATADAPAARTASASPHTTGDTGLRALPLHDFDQNQIWCAVIALAGDLLAWMPMLALPGSQVRRREPKRLRMRLFTIPATRARHARRNLVHLAETAPWAHLAQQVIDRLRELRRLGVPQAVPG